MQVYMDAEMGIDMCVDVWKSVQDTWFDKKSSSTELKHMHRSVRCNNLFLTRTAKTSEVSPDRKSCRSFALMSLCRLLKKVCSFTSAALHGKPLPKMTARGPHVEASCRSLASYCAAVVAGKGMKERRAGRLRAHYGA